MVALLVILPALAVLLAGLSRPGRAMPLFAFFATLLPVQAYLELNPALPILTAHRAMVLALFAVHGLQTCQSGTSRRSPLPTPFRNIIIVSTVLFLVSSLLSVDVLASTKKWIGLIVEAYVFYLIGVRLVSSREDVKATVFAIVAAVGLAACLGLVQAYTTWSPLDHLPTPSREALHYQLELGGPRSGRPLSVFPHPILLGAAIALAFPLALAVLSEAASMPRRRLWTWLFLPVMAWCLYKTLSRGPWLAALLAALVVFKFSARPARRILVLGALAMAAAFLLRPGVWETAFNLFAQSTNTNSPLGVNFYYRFELYRIAYEALGRDIGRTLFGYGLNTFSTLELTGYFMGRHRVYTSCDNSWAELAIGGGLLGVAAMAVMLGSVALFAYRTLRCAPPADKAVCAALFADILAFLFLMTNVAIYGWAQFGYLLWLLVALTVAMERLGRGTLPEALARPARSRPGPKPAARRALPQV